MTSKDASGQKSLTLELSLVGKMKYKHWWESVSNNYIYNWVELGAMTLLRTWMMVVCLGRQIIGVENVDNGTTLSVCNDNGRVQASTKPLLF